MPFELTQSLCSLVSATKDSKPRDQLSCAWVSPAFAARMSPEGGRLWVLQGQGSRTRATWKQMAGEAERTLGHLSRQRLGRGGTSMTTQWVLPLSSTNLGLVSEVESIAKT